MLSEMARVHTLLDLGSTACAGAALHAHGRVLRLPEGRAGAAAGQRPGGQRRLPHVPRRHPQRAAAAHLLRGALMLAWSKYYAHMPCGIRHATGASAAFSAVGSCVALVFNGIAGRQPLCGCPNGCKKASG